MNNLLLIALYTALLPLASSLIAGLLGKFLGRTATHRIVITLIGLAFALACYLFYVIIVTQHSSVQGIFYTWASSGLLQFDVAFLIDPLSVTMASVVLFVSLMVHIYTIGYMADDPGYTRFFSYVSLFTFAMLMLVFANNFLLLFFGWEGVGLVSYLLIGFWFKREKANFGSLKAFLVNRVGDVGFLLGLASVLLFFGSLNYTDVFQQAASVAGKTTSIFGQPISVITLIGMLLFIGAMAKSAQVPLHVWLPESMEGPTPISALIHAATMVTAGIYMIARMSPLFEYSPVMLNVILTLGATTAFFMGLLAVVQFDIKRVIAYSTISQLGYMAAALGASAYDAAIFHLITHAFFKALLFLAAGSVIIALHHEQDMRKMGGLASYLPVTYLTFVIGALALSAIPPFSGFYSKDIIIEAVANSHLPASKFAYYCVLAGAFLTPLYIFRALFMTFHTNERMSPEVRSHIKESPWVVLIPLIALAVPSVISGQMLIEPMLIAEPTMLAKSIFVLPAHDSLREIADNFPGVRMMALEAGRNISFWLSMLGILCAWFITAGFPQVATACKARLDWVYWVLVKKYGFDDFNQLFFVRGTRALGNFFYRVTDAKLIDDIAVNGSARFVRFFAATARHLQTGYVYHYALAMVLGTVVFGVWLVWPQEVDAKPQQYAVSQDTIKKVNEGGIYV